MSRCPVCSSARIVVVLSPERRAFCARCGSRWLQDGSEQRAIERVELNTVDLNAIEAEPTEEAAPEPA